jgi:chromosome segregation ATPase
MQLDEAVAALQTKDRQIFEASTANASQFLERQQRLEEAKSEIAALREKLEGMAKDLHVKEQQILDNTANASQLLERQQQLDEARSEIEAQREKLEAMAPDLRSKDHQAHDVEAAIESLKAKEPDAIKLVNTLLNENTSLQEENRILGLQLAGAEKDVDQQLAWSLIRAERRRTAHPKRMRPSGEEDVVSLAEPSAKRPRQVVSGTVEDMAEDATNERLPSVDDALMLDGV